MIFEIFDFHSFSSEASGLCKPVIILAANTAPRGAAKCDRPSVLKMHSLAVRILTFSELTLAAN